MAATKTIKFMSEKSLLCLFLSRTVLLYFYFAAYIHQMFILIPNEFGCIESKVREDKSIFSVLV